MFAILAVVSCGDNRKTGLDAISHIDADDIDSGSIDGTTIDASHRADPSPSRALSTRACGTTRRTRCSYDSQTDKLIKYTDAGGLADVVALPTAANTETGVSLGTETKQATGDILVANFGFGRTARSSTSPRTSAARSRSRHRCGSAAGDPLLRERARHSA